MIAFLALAAAAAVPPAPAATAATAAAENQIVVRGRSLANLEADLARCIAGRCALRQDVIASVRVGEALFRQGRYAQSRALLQRAVARDRGRGATDVGAMAALYEATATVASHDGELEVERQSDAARFRLLRDAFGPDSPSALRAELDLAIAVASFETRAVSNARFSRLTDRARAAEQPVIAAAATLRVAVAAARYGEDGRADRLFAAVATDRTLPAALRIAAYGMAAHSARGAAKGPALATYRAALAQLGQAEPVLLAAPPPPTPADVADLNYFDLVDTQTHAEDFVGARWADVGFLIQPDGRVAAPEKLRGTLGAGDTDQVVAAIGKRRYSAFGAADGPRYRVERWTLTADYATPTGSLVRRRLRNPHYRWLDITAGDPPAATAAAAAGG